jgi:hypothetical protein
MLNRYAGCAAIAVLILGGCGRSEQSREALKPPAAALELAPMPPPLPPLPSVDAAAIRASLTPDDTLETLSFERDGSTTVTGAVEGDKTKVWVVPVAAGQTLTITFQTESANLYVNVVDSADNSGAAVHRGQVDGPDANIHAQRDTVYLIKPFQPRAPAAREERGAYTLIVARS